MKESETQTERKHMPLPFQVLDGAILCASVNDFGNFYVASLDRGGVTLTEQDRETLEFVALACNSHYDLKEQRDDLLSAMENIECNLTGRDCPQARWEDALRRARAAIDKATP